MWGILAGLLIALFLLFALLLIFWKAYFLREPARFIPKGDNIVSPASGTIIRVMKFGGAKVDLPKGLLGNIRDITSDIGTEGYVIAIFMSPFDVHCQRAPISGRISSVKYAKGRFYSARQLALENEKNEIIIEDLTVKVKVIQVAGLMARRIECTVKEGQEILKGQTLGRINLGSQVIAVLQKNVKIKVKEGQYVKDGETVLAEF